MDLITWNVNVLEYSGVPLCTLHSYTENGQLASLPQRQHGENA